MKHIFLMFLAATFFNIAASGQTANPSTPPAPPPSNPQPAASNNNSSNQQGGSRQNSAAQNAASQRQNLAMRALELEMLSRPMNDPFSSIRPDVDKLYRKTNKKDLKKLDFNQQDFTNFAPFLREKNTGLIKLLPDAGCDKGTSVLVVTEACLKYDFPGAGSAYSFRLADYRSHQLSDLIFSGDRFYSNSVWTQGIFVTVGDVPLEQLNLQTPELKYLVDFQPSNEQEKALTFQKQLLNGVKANGFLYTQVVGLEENTTYALRSVAYNGKFYREVKGVIYDEFSFDKRKDILVGFRVIRKESDGGVTVLWKELSRKDSPKLISTKKK